MKSLQIRQKPNCHGGKYTCGLSTTPGGLGEMGAAPERVRTERGLAVSVAFDGCDMRKPVGTQRQSTGPVPTPQQHLALATSARATT